MDGDAGDDMISITIDARRVVTFKSAPIAEIGNQFQMTNNNKIEL
jgi:hypothetical protein